MKGAHGVTATGVAQMARRADGVVHMLARTVARLKARRQVLDSTTVCTHRVHLQLLRPGLCARCTAGAMLCVVTALGQSPSCRLVTAWRIAVIGVWRSTAWWTPG